MTVYGCRKSAISAGSMAVGINRMQSLAIGNVFMHITNRLVANLLKGGGAKPPV